MMMILLWLNPHKESSFEIERIERNLIDDDDKYDKYDNTKKNEQ